MKSKNLLIVLLVCTAFLFGCTEDDNTALELKGTYTGTFTVNYKDGSSFSNPMTVEFNDGNFSSSSGADRFPAGGTGNFEVVNRKVKFVDKNI